MLCNPGNAGGYDPNWLVRLAEWHVVSVCIIPGCLDWTILRGGWKSEQDTFWLWMTVVNMVTVHIGHSVRRNLDICTDCCMRARPFTDVNANSVYTDHVCWHDVHVLAVVRRGYVESLCYEHM